MGLITMVAHKDNIQARWPELKDKLRQRWPRLTAEDVARPSCTAEELVGTLRRRYGYAEAQAMMEINRWIADGDKARPLARGN